MADVSCRRRFSGGLLLTYRNAADTSDIQHAIGNLSELATQTKRQADNTHEQLGAVRDQVSALKDQAEEAKLQTAAIAKQTEPSKPVPTPPSGRQRPLAQPPELNKKWLKSRPRHINLMSAL